MAKPNFKGWQRILMLIIPYLIVVGIFVSIGSFLIGIDFLSEEPDELVKSTFQKLVISLSDLTGTLLVLWFFVVNVDQETFKDLGFSIQNRLKDFKIGLIIGLIIMVTIGSILTLIGEVSIANIKFDPLEVLMTVLLFTSVSVVEETLIRGYVLKNMMLSFNKYIALILSSIIFSLLHAANPSVTVLGLIDLFLAGIVLGIPYMYTKNLWMPIGIHLSWNLFQSLLGFNVSGQDTYSIIELEYVTENITNGGAFGIEGSYFSVIAEILTIIWLFWYFEKKAKPEVVVNE